MKYLLATAAVLALNRRIRYARYLRFILRVVSSRIRPPHDVAGRGDFHVAQNLDCAALNRNRSSRTWAGGPCQLLTISFSIRPYVRTIEKPLQKIVSGYRPWRGAEQPGDWKTY